MVIGADLAINHGALVTDNKIVYTYQTGAGMQSSAETLRQRAIVLVDKLPRNCTLAIDWDRTSGSWGKNPLVGTLMTILNISFGVLAIEIKNANVHYITPKVIRECLNLPVRCKKEFVHSSVIVPNFIVTHHITGSKLIKDNLYGDLVDAWLLADTFNCSVEG